MIGKYTLFWFVLMVIAILNGTIRQVLYLESIGELAAHQVSCFTGLTMFFLVTWWINRTWVIPSTASAWLIGMIWLLMTVIFEFGFGHYIMGHTWARLVEDYNLLAGRLWLLVLTGILIIPYLVFRFSNK